MDAEAKFSQAGEAVDYTPTGVRTAGPGFVLTPLRQTQKALRRSKG